MWDDPYLFKIGADNLLSRCVTRGELLSIVGLYGRISRGLRGGDNKDLKNPVVLVENNMRVLPNGHVVEI